MRPLVLVLCCLFALLCGVGSAHSGSRVENGLQLADPAATGENGLQARLLFTSNRRGEFEPCSCPEVPLGGISQAVAKVEAIRGAEHPVFWLDSGDRFFRVDMALISTDEAERRLRALLLVDAANLGGLDAMGIGRLDLGAGLEYLKKLSRRASFPVLSANLVDSAGSLLFEPSVLLKKGDLAVGVPSVVADDTLGDGFATIPWKKALRTEAKKLRKQGAQLVVVLSNLGEQGDRKLARLGAADVILSSRDRLLTPKGERMAKTLLGQAGARGRYLGDLRWYRSGSGKGPHLVLTTMPVHSGGPRSTQVDELVDAVLLRLSDPVLGVPPIPYQLQDDPRRGVRE